MSNLPSNLPDLLKRAGLDVVTVGGWRGRERPGPFGPVGVLNHHTGASARGWTLDKELAYAKWMFLEGRPNDGLPAPLVQIALGRSGRVYIGAAGRSNHAGRAKSSGSVAAGDGNALYVGVEWMLSGTEKIPAHMRKAGVTLNAVLTHEVTKTSVRTVSCHYQTSVTGKWDIGDPDGIAYRGHRVLDVNKFRRDVEAERERLYEAKAAPRIKNPFPPLPDGPIAQWNCKVGDRASFPYALARFRGKAIVALQETGGHRGDIRAWARRYGYRIITGGDESSMLLIHDSVEVRHSGVLTSPVKWYGPKGKAIEGRSFPWARVVLDGRDQDFVVVHMPWGWNRVRNFRAWVSCSSMIRNFGLNHPVPPQWYLGDFNQPGYIDRLWSILRTARRIKAVVIPTGASVDYLLYRPACNDAPPINKPVGHKGTSRMGGDHYPVTYETKA